MMVDFEDVYETITEDSFPQNKICILCDGYWKLPEGFTKGYCFNRSNHWLPENLKEKFICAECASFLLESLVGHSKNALYKQFEWTKGIMPEHSGCIMCPIKIAYKKWKEGGK